MTVETGVFGEESKKKEAKSKEKELKEAKKIIDFQKKKEVIRLQIEASENLLELKSMLISGEFDLGSLVNISCTKLNNICTSTNDLNKVEVIIEKINKINSNNSSSKYIPENLKITKEEYLDSLKDSQKKQQLLIKIDQVLGVLASHITGFKGNGLSFMFGFGIPVDKKLTSIQEDTIDIKRSLIQNT